MTRFQKAGIFIVLKNGIKPSVKELIFIFATPLKKENREVAQAGSAPGLGPGGRRFESCLPDKEVDPIHSGFSQLKRIASILIGAFLTKKIIQSFSQGEVDEWLKSTVC